MCRSGSVEWAAQCNQSECQYVDANELPCPLNLGLFETEMKAIADARASRDEYR